MVEKAVSGAAGRRVSGEGDNRRRFRIESNTAGVPLLTCLPAFQLPRLHCYPNPLARLRLASH
jgi:hypothetical protein